LEEGEFMRSKIRNLIMALIIIGVYGQGVGAIDFEDGLVSDPLLGDTIDLAERNGYNLFPEVRGFRWATLARDQENNLYARICAVVDGQETYVIQPLGAVDQYNRRFESPAEVGLSGGGSIFIAAGAGYHLGSRFEFGGTDGRNVAVALTLHTGDSWSNGDPFFGLQGRVNLPLRKVIPYLSLEWATTVDIMTGDHTDSFLAFGIGCMIPASSHFHLRQETGMAFSSKYISGGQGWLFTPTRPLVKEHDTNPYFHFALEFDFRSVYHHN
jgi:hypothetical protein